ncbi:MAG: twin-arginine translocase TatA/TatE family subunit [Thermodesulfobacteriota bacterium]|nr:twin-arginine translocase TatA/TatE family subunit [Thermodesulfobacteriota bacterium]MEE2975333.1 twin-arginine translocase TatA/TatE family subunit [Thermodesulfobacteriota bacterium]|tara:strand:+ start:1229 stop:1420 length:192 start_codon:yes stop_codon:yes gene_type:complete
MFGLGFTEILFVLIVFILLFGPDEVPKIAKKCSKFYRDVINIKEDLNRSVNEEINDIKKTVEK